MYAIIGLPGSTHHEYEHFPATRSTVREVRQEAEAWLERRYQEKLDANPACSDFPTEIISDREAARVRYLDGRRVYVSD